MKNEFNRFIIPVQRCERERLFHRQNSLESRKKNKTRVNRHEMIHRH